MDLIERYFDIAIKSPDGIKKLREMILSLAMQGKLVPQDPSDPPASELLKEIEAEKKKLVKEGKIKKQEPLPPIKPQEVPYALPTGWELIRTGNIIELISGQHLTPNEYNSNRIGIPYYTGPADFGVFSPTATRWTLLEKATAICGDVLLTVKGAGVGKTNVVLDDKVAISRQLMALRPIIIEKDFLIYFLQFSFEALQKMAVGIAIPGIGREDVLTNPFPLPPLAEQKRIVAKVDELMALCDKLETERDARNEKRVAVQKASVDRLLTVSDEAGFASSWEFIARNFADLYSVAENVIELKKAILQLAVMGKLVPQDPNDPPASELLKQIEVEKKKLVKEGKIKKQDPLPPIKPGEAPYALPAGWEWVRLGEILIKYGAGSTPLGGQKVYQTSGIMFLRSQNIWNDGLRIDDVARIDQSIHEKMSGTKVEVNDILLNITGASIGRSSIFPSGLDDANVSQHVAILRTVTAAVVEYLHLYIIAPSFQDEIMDKQVGVSREGLSMSKLKEFPIPLPPLAEQKRIVAKVDALMTLCDELEQQLKDATDKQTAILNAVVAAM